MPIRTFGKLLREKERERERERETGPNFSCLHKSAASFFVKVQSEMHDSFVLQ